MILSKKRGGFSDENKRVLAALLIAAMTVGLTACGGSSDSNGSAAGTETGSTKADGDYEQVTYAYSTFNNIPTEEDLDVVEEEINKITREKIGVEVTLEPIAFADYPSKVSLALQGGEKSIFMNPLVILIIMYLLI